MSSQTPIKLMSYRGPLATPPTSSSSNRSSPCSTWSTSPTDISSRYSPPFKSVIDVHVFRPKSTALNAFTTHRHRQSLRRFFQNREPRALPDSRFRKLQLEFENLVHQVSDLAKNIIVALMFCMMFLRLFGLASCSSHLACLSAPLRISMTHLFLPSAAGYIRCQLNLSPCEPREPHAAVLQFLTEQIQHAKALSSISASLSLPLRTFQQTHHALTHILVPRHRPSRLPYFSGQEMDTLRNLTDLLDTPLLDFASSSFLGRSFSLALDELDDLMSEPAAFYNSSPYKELQDAHSYAIFYRTTSNLLLAYSASRRQAESVFQHIHTLHQKLSLSIPCQEDVHNIQKWFHIPHKCYARPPTAATEKSLQAYITALGATMEAIRLLSSSLDRVTEQLVQTTLEDILTPGRRTDFYSAVVSLQELFAQSRHPPTRRHLISSRYLLMQRE